MSDADVLVIGAGQAGLAATYWLKQLGLSTITVDAAPRVGDSWRGRYRSLTLFTPREFSALPGMSLEGDQAGYASGIEFADYLERYAITFSLPVQTSEGVVRLTKERGRFVAKLRSEAVVKGSAVVIATGGFQQAFVPPMASGLSSSVLQLTANSYRQPTGVRTEPVVVVGDGASGRDISSDLASIRRVILACGSPRRLLPERMLGRSIWHWLRAFGLMNATPTSLIGRAMRRADPFPNRQRDLEALRRQGIEIKPRVISAKGRLIGFHDGSAVEAGTVIWTLGYRDLTEWVAIEGAVVGGTFAHERGVSPVPGLYFVGRPWQRNRASALIMGVGEDAKVIAQAIERFLRQLNGPATATVHSSHR